MLSFPDGENVNGEDSPGRFYLPNGRLVDWAFHMPDGLTETFAFFDPTPRRRLHFRVFYDGEFREEFSLGAETQHDLVRFIGCDDCDSHLLAVDPVVLQAMRKGLR